MQWQRLFERARRRHGVVCLADGREFGISSRRMQDRAERDGWFLLHPGVWLVGGIEPTDLSRLTAAVLAGRGAVASHRSALWLHGAVDRAPRMPQILVPYGGRGPTGGQPIEVHRTRRLPEHHVTTAHVIPCTIPARSILDVSGSVNGRALKNLVVDTRHRAGLSMEELAAMREAFGARRRGMAGLDRVLADPVVGVVDTAWEAEVHEVLTAAGLVVVSQFPYRCADGVVVRLDNALPGEWVCVETDGRSAHSGQVAFARDRVRWNQIQREWKIVWVTYDRWNDDRAGVMADVMDAVERADPSRPPARPAA